jgi:hypothetical protein
MNSKTQFHVMSGRRVVATRTGPSAREVALDYVRSMGCKRDEIIYYGLDGVSWRGAVYRAQQVGSVEPSRACRAAAREPALTRSARSRVFELAQV